ncbi:aminotransferase-like domain-containing protein [Silvimonas iriomotensis]|uniref:Putative 8-amino-7-oxononanoate synthase n=1 Tax=Silvimonas iriomotensis TaxID=449662 RepID=A0ABQ2P822_9NEIS|nr:PLP-dependent aminotransferase family protein [Silvimonas iriomotensis]GGP20281.1 GntR family transcriptional regulator [Silvimonas iriomotensis]
MNHRTALPAFALDTASTVPLVTQLHDVIIEQINRGLWAAGMRLPSVRALAKACAVSTLTVTNAYNRLVAEGYVEARRASGYFVQARLPEKPRARVDDTPLSIDSLLLLQRVYGDDSLSIKPGSGWLPDAMLFTDGIKHGLATLARRQPNAFARYGHAYGYAPLRQQIQTQLAARNIDAAPEQIILTHGASHALDLVARTLLQPGDTVLVDDPGYCNLLPTLRHMGVNIVGIEFTTQGPNTQALQRAAEQHQPKAFFTNTNLQNPTGACCSPATAFRILQLAGQHDFYVVEDDIFADLHPATAHSLAALDQLQRVIHIGSFSKTISPSLRVGFMACHPALAEKLVFAKMAQGLTTSEINEQLVHAILVEGNHRSHLARLRARLAEAQQQTGDALTDCGLQLFHRPAGGMFVWAGLPAHTDMQALAADAARQGMLLAPGYLFKPDQSATPWMRFNVAHAQSAELYRFLQKTCTASTS